MGWVGIGLDWLSVNSLLGCSVLTKLGCYLHIKSGVGGHRFGLVKCQFTVRLFGVN